MKKKLLLSLLAVAISGVSVTAQNVSTSSTSVTRTADECPFKMHYGNKLSFVSHQRGGTNVNHQANDYMLFNQNGTYQAVFNGQTVNGTWVYHKATNEVEIITQGSGKYMIQGATATKLDLYNRTEVMSLRPITATNTENVAPVGVEQPTKSTDKAVTTQSGNTQVEGAKVTAPFSMHYNVKLKIGVHKKNNIKVGHNGNDYVQLNSNGTYTQQWNGIVTNGTWTYDPVTNLLKVVTKTTNEYKVTESTAERLIIESATDYISLYPGK